MTLLTIVNDAQAVLNLPITSTVVTNTGDTQRQLLRLCNMAGREIARAYPWQVLVTERSFTTTATEQQTGETLPADFGWVVDDTLWNRTTTDRVWGPLSSQSWQAQKATGTSVAWSQFRIRANSFYFLPSPTAGQTIYYEYVSKYWCESSGGTDQEKWAADTDVGRIDEYLLTLGLIWRWKAAKGLYYEEEKAEFDRELSAAKARDGARRRTSIAGPSTRPFGWGKVPEGNWS